jgi:hypothetical protein
MRDAGIAVVAVHAELPTKGVRYLDHNLVEIKNRVRRGEAWMVLAAKIRRINPPE